MKVGLGVSALCGARGGTQRAAVSLAHGLRERGHQLEFFCFRLNERPAYPLDGGIPVNFVPHGFQYGENAGIHKVKETLVTRSIDVFISMESTWIHMLWQLACLGTGIPFICSERSDPLFTETVTWSRAGRHASLACADFIHELSDAHREAVPAIWRKKVRVIHNAAPELVSEKAMSPAPAILFLGRFVPTKRVFLLLEAFARLAPAHARWRLLLRGSGMQEKSLRAYMAKKGLSDRVAISHAVGNLGEDYGGAQIYCLPTKVEGFPNSVLEAMAAGLPVVGIADCPAMRDMENVGAGLLAPEATAESLAMTLERLMVSEELRQRMGEAGRRACGTIYQARHIYGQWEHLLYEAMAVKGRTIMDGFTQEPFASMATLSAAARREWIYRNFGDPYPYTAKWLMERAIRLGLNIFKKLWRKTFDEA